MCKMNFCFFFFFDILQFIFTVTSLVVGASEDFNLAAVQLGEFLGAETEEFDEGRVRAVEEEKLGIGKPGDGLEFPEPGVAGVLREVYNGEDGLLVPGEELGVIADSFDLLCRDAEISLVLLEEALAGRDVELCEILLDVEARHVGEQPAPHRDEGLVETLGAEGAEPEGLRASSLGPVLGELFQEVFCVFPKDVRLLRAV